MSSSNILTGASYRRGGGQGSPRPLSCTFYPSAAVFPFQIFNDDISVGFFHFFSMLLSSAIPRNLWITLVLCSVFLRPKNNKCAENKMNFFQTAQKNDKNLNLASNQAVSQYLCLRSHCFSYKIFIFLRRKYKPTTRYTHYTILQFKIL